MLDIKWNSLSLRQGITLSMAVTLLPLLFSAGFGYFLLHRTVIGSYQDVARLERDVLLPVRQLQLLMLQVEIPLEEYLVIGTAEKLAEFRTLRREVETTFPVVLQVLDGQPAVEVNRSRDDWTLLDRAATDLLAAHQGGDRAALLAAQSRFDSLRTSAYDKLEAVSALLERDVERDYRAAELGFERSEWITGIAAGVSLLLMAAGIGLFYRSIINSVDRLIEGAERFSKGDRDHRIEIQIPRELHLVAEEFNKMIGTIRDSEDKLIDMAHTDSLTGLWNCATWEEALVDALKRVKRFHESVAVVSADIDHFKSVNDTFGHDAGDMVLREVAGILQQSVRDIDKVFRLGGEEFALLLPAADEAGARSTAERIRNAVAERTIRIGGRNLRVTISLGIAIASSGAETAATLAKEADTALYRAKQSGRNRVVVYQNDMA